MTTDDQELETARREVEEVRQVRERLRDPKYDDALKEYAAEVTHRFEAEMTSLEDLAEARRDTTALLIDRSIPLLTAILGGISYVLIEHKVGVSIAQKFFIASGAAFVLAIISIFYQAWLQPRLDYEYSQLQRAIAAGEKPDHRSILASRMKAILFRRGLTVGLISFGLLSAVLAVVFTSERL